MEEYRKKLVRDIWMARGLAVVSFLFAIFTIFIYKKEIQGVVEAVMTAVFIGSWQQIRQNKTLLKDEEAFKKQYILISDERKVKIQEKAADLSTAILFTLLVLGSIVFYFINKIVSITLVVVLGVKMCVLLLSNLYYEKKM